MIQFDEHSFQMGWNHQPVQGVCEFTLTYPKPNFFKLFGNT